MKMSKIYQNGDKMLGLKKDLRKYNEKLLNNKTIDKDTYLEFEEAMLGYKENAMLVVDLEFGMGIYVEEWDEVIDKNGK
jgi:hypothetical protein